MLRDFILIALRALALLLLTVASLELVLQLAFPHLPKALVEPMPQYLERIGYRLNTAHGARQLPASQNVEYQVTALSGDLYRGSCITSADAQPFESYRVQFKRDAQGFRNEEPWPDDIDLAVLGDSFTAAELIQRPFWQDLSESMLVLAMPGSGTLEQQQLFKAFAWPRKPETVVLAFFSGNDLHDNSHIAWIMHQGWTWHDVVHLGKKAYDYSVVFRLLQFMSEAALPAAEEPCHFPLIAHTDPPTPVVFFRKFLPQLRQKEEALLESEPLRLTRTSIEEMASALSGSGGDLIIMYIPTKLEMYWQYLDDESKARYIEIETREHDVPGLKYLDANLHAQRHVMRDLAAELGVAFLDLTPPLDEAIRQGISPYFFADTHWNQQGHNIARNALLDLLNQSNLET